MIIDIFVWIIMADILGIVLMDIGFILWIFLGRGE